MDDAQKERSARIVNATSAAILKAAGAAMSGYDGPDAGAILTAAFAMAADRITAEIDPPFSRTLYEMLKSRVAPGAAP